MAAKLEFHMLVLKKKLKRKNGRTPNLTWRVSWAQASPIVHFKEAENMARSHRNNPIKEQKDQGLLLMNLPGEVQKTFSALWGLFLQLPNLYDWPCIGRGFIVPT